MNLVELLLEEKRIIEEMGNKFLDKTTKDFQDIESHNTLKIANTRSFILNYFIESMMDQETKMANQDKLIRMESPEQLFEMYKGDQLKFTPLRYDGYVYEKTGLIMIGGPTDIFGPNFSTQLPCKVVRCPETMTVDEFAKLYIEELNKTLSLALGENVSQEQIAEEISKACTEAFCKINNIQSQTL